MVRLPLPVLFGGVYPLLRAPLETLGQKSLSILSVSSQGKADLQHVYISQAAHGVAKTWTTLLWSEISDF